MTRALYFSDDIYYHYDLENKKHSEHKSLVDVGIDSKDFVITYNQGFMMKNIQLDICIIEKIIFFQGSKNIKNLYQKYLHKAYEHKNNKGLLEAVIKVFSKQRLYVKQKGIEKQVLWECANVGNLAYINSAVLKIKEDFVKSVDGEWDYKENILSRDALVLHCTNKRYNIYNLGVGKFNLTHERLLSFNDELINKHVEAEKFRGEHLYKKQYAKETLNINHNQWGAVTGRVTTSDPNIQGIKNDIIDYENLVSFDYVAFEMMIFLSVYKPEIYKQFISSGKKDVYAFIYKQVIGNIDYDSDEMKKNDPGKRNVFKKTILAVLYGAQWEELKFINSLEWDGFKNMHNDISELLNLKVVNNNLMEYLRKTGRFYIGSDHHCTVGTKESNQYADIYPQSSKFESIVSKLKENDYFEEKRDLTEYHELFTKERGLVEELNTLKSSIQRNLISYHIQGLGAMIIKTAAKYIVSAARKSRLLILKHDEALVDVNEEGQDEIIVKAMQDAFYDIVKGSVNVEIRKIQNTLNSGN